MDERVYTRGTHTNDKDTAMKQILRTGLLMMVAAVGLVLAGCGETYERRTVLVGVPLPMTTEDVVAAVKAGDSQDAVISKLQRSGFDGALTTRDVDRLRDEGVPEPVLDWMLTHPGALPSAPIRGGMAGVPGGRVVVVEQAPEVVVIERSPPVTYSIGIGYYSGRYYHGHRSYGRSYYRHSPYRRSWRSSGRRYHYTSGR